jgi:hypothetical protein
MATAMPPELDAASAQVAGSTLGGAVEMAAQNPLVAEALLAPAHVAFTSGMLTAAAIGLASLLLMAVYVNRALR